MNKNKMDTDLRSTLQVSDKLKVLVLSLGNKLLLMKIMPANID